MNNKEIIVIDSDDDSDVTASNIDINNLFKEEIIEDNNIKKNNRIKLTSFYDLIEYFLDENKAIGYLFEKKAIINIEKCTSCNSKMNYYLESRRFRCISYKCRKSISIFKGTIFYKSKLPINKILHIIYEYLKKTPRNSVVATLNISPITVTYYYKLIREVISKNTIKNLENDMIGGENSIVELDESLFCKRKYNKGHKVDGVWVLGGIDRGTKKYLQYRLKKEIK